MACKQGRMTTRLAAIMPTSISIMATVLEGILDPVWGGGEEG